MVQEPRRNITKLAKLFWDKNIPFKQGNTRIDIMTNEKSIVTYTDDEQITSDYDFVTLSLFDNIIAAKKLNKNNKSNGITIWSMRGFGTVTTRERLKAVGLTIRQRNFTQEYLDETKQEWIPFTEYDVFELNNITKEIRKIKDNTNNLRPIDSTGIDWGTVFL